MNHVQRTHPNTSIYYGWIIVAVIALAAFTRMVETVQVMGIFLKPITLEFGWSRSIFTGVMAIGTIMGGIISLGAGNLIDRFGGRYVLTGALGILGGLLVLTSLIRTLWQFFLLQITARMVQMGIIELAVQVIIPKWFIKKRGRAIALGGLGTTVGGLITPIYVQFLVSESGWRIAIATTGLVIWVLAIIPLYIFLRRQPEDIGLLPDGVSTQNNAESVPDISRKIQLKHDISLSVYQVIRLPSFYLLAIGMGLVFFISSGQMFHAVAYFTDQNLSASTAVTAVAMIAIGAGIGSFISGILADKHSSRTILTIDLILLSSSFILIQIAHSSLFATIWGLYFGLGIGGMFSLQQVILPDYYGRKSLGTVRSLIWPVQMGVNSVGPFAVALAYDITGGYTLIWSLFGILTLISSLCIFLAKPPNIDLMTSSDINTFK